MSMGGFNAAALVGHTDQATVLLAAVKLLRASVEQFNSPSLCFVSDLDWPSVEVQQNVFCTVSPSDGEFDQAGIIGGANVQVLEASTLQVNVFSRIQLDRIEHAPIAFLDRQRGLLPLKKSVLKALAGRQLYGDYPTNMIPLLTKWLTPMHAKTGATKKEEDDFVFLSITFDAPFYWDLT
jgi:hypothetical protein